MNEIISPDVGITPTEKSSVSDTALPENTGISSAESLSPFYVSLGVITRKIEGKDVTVAERAYRAHLYRKAMEAKARDGGMLSPENRHNLRVEHDHLIDNEREFHQQRALSINIPEYGELKACYSILNPEADPANPPIILITGSSNNVESMDSFVHELAKEQPNRKIIVLAYPEASSGQISEQFYSAVKAADGFQPHSKVFKSIIQYLCPEGDLELWGVSTGGAIVSTLLTDPFIAERVSDAALICPWCSAEQTPTGLLRGALNDSIKLISRIRQSAKFNWIHDKDERKTPQGILKNKTWKAIGEKGRNPITANNLPKIHLRHNAKMVIVSGGDDQITNSAAVFNEKTESEWKRKQPALVTAVIPHASHNGPLLQPTKFVEKILSKLQR